MRTKLRLLAAILALSAVAVWAALGANRGFTKTQIAVDKTDEITGITVKEWRDTFVPGVELLAGALGVSAAVFAASFLIRQPKSNS